MIRLFLSCTVLFYCAINSLAQTPGTIKWKFQTAKPIDSSPAIGTDGTIYFGSDDTYLYALNADGTQKWKFKTASGVSSSPAIGADGTIYFGSDDTYLYALNADGTQKWKFKTAGIVRSSAAIRADGTIYFGSDDNCLTALNADGTQKWKFKTADDIKSSPVIDAYGTIYFGSMDQFLYALNADGTQKWKFKSKGVVYSSPAIGADGTIYFGSFEKYLYALNADGTQKWNFIAPGYINSSPAIGADGTIYFGSWDKYLYALNADGTQKWKFQTAGNIESSPAIGADGTIYFGSYDNYLYALGADGRQKWKFNADNWVTSSPAIGTDGTIYFGSFEYFLYAVNCGNTKLANSSWAKFHKNNQNTGSLEKIISGKFDFYAKYLIQKQNVDVNLEFSKSANKEVIISQVVFENNKFRLNSTLPIVVANNVNFFSIPLTLINPGTELYESSFQITYSGEAVTDTFSGKIQVAVILEDNSELSVVGKRAIEAYNNSMGSNQVATLNNRGVIYRLMDYPDLAKQLFNRAVSMSLNKHYGFAGIKMNQGVVQSDMDSTLNAEAIYKSAVGDISSGQVTSVLAPQIIYNQAWEKYVNEDYIGAETLALQTINHTKANAWLKAKAYALLGAIKYVKEDVEGAVKAFQMAYSLDINGPIGKMAQENMGLITSVPGISNNSELHVYPQPAADYMVVEYKGNSFKEVVTIELIDMTGKVVYSEQLYPSGLGFYHSIDVNNFPAGMYNLKLNSSELNEVHKIIIQ